MHVEWTDERIILIPLMWIPTSYNASVEDREKFEISQSCTMIIWDPEKCGINDEISIVDYPGPTRDQHEGGSIVYRPREKEKQIAEGKTRRKKK